MSMTSSAGSAGKTLTIPARPRHLAIRGLVLTALGFLLLWAVMDRVAAATDSTLGEGGLWVLLAVLVTALLLEYVISGRAPIAALSSIGVRWPDRRATLVTLGLAAALLAFYPIFAAATGASLSITAGAGLLALGIFAQGGLAEELVFRGFLFRRLREGRTFWRAASLAAIPFVAVHSLLFLTLDPAIAAISILVALSMSFPLSFLFERGGNSVWLPALLHAVVQGSIKLVDAGDDTQLMAMAWMCLAITVPWLVFFFLRRKRNDF